MRSAHETGIIACCAGRELDNFRKIYTFLWRLKLFPQVASATSTNLNNKPATFQVLCGSAKALEPIESECLLGMFRANLHNLSNLL